MRENEPPISGVDGRRLPPEWQRTVVSFLILLHSFVVLVGVIANWNPSTLAMRLRQNVPFVKPYLQYLGMDQAYAPQYALTWAMDEDTDVSVEIELNLPDGTTTNFALPSSDLWPRQRWRHDERLAETTADVTGESFRNIESLLPQAIAAHFVKTYGAKGGTIRCMRHFLQEIEVAGSSDPYDPSRYRRLYEARIIVAGDQVQLLKTEAAAEVAPAAVDEGQP